MKNTDNNQQEVPQVKSMEERMTDIIRRIPVNQANFDYISKRQYGINGSLALDIKSAMKEYASPLQSRIAELEAELKTIQPFVESLEIKVIRLEKENAVYKEALEDAVSHIKHTTPKNHFWNGLSKIEGILKTVK